MVRFPLTLAVRLRTSQSGREEADPAAAPLTVYTLTITEFYFIKFFFSSLQRHMITTPSVSRKIDQ